MKLFLDTAVTEEIETHFSTGLIDGVTTNPTLMMKSGRRPDDVYAELKSMGLPDISMEVMGTTDEMYKEGMRLSEKFGEVATIKVPCTVDGLRTCKTLSDQGVKTNVTLVFSVSQAILAAKAGATYVSPFVGRLNDNSFSGVALVQSIAGTYATQRVSTQILAASLRDVHHVGRCFAAGADVCTLPPSVFSKMYNHILTDKGLELFDKDSQSIKV